MLTDHNKITELDWDGKMLVIPGVELTQSLHNCEPPPETGKKCLPHMNALFATPTDSDELPWPERTSLKRIDLYQRALDAVTAYDALPMLNHPNFHWTVNKELAKEIASRGVVLLEVFNQGMVHSNPGNAHHMSTEELWDALLTDGVHMWGVATDDAHHYDDVERARAAGGPVYPAGLGWVMVRARRNPAAIREALENGDFYSSTGVTLSKYNVTEEAIELAVKGTATFKFIGMGGKVLAKSTGTSASFALSNAKGGYVRAVVTDKHDKHAWTQPVWVP